MQPQAPLSDSLALTIPEYLSKNYQWAYVDPRAVYVFERQWLVNAILWGNFARLRDAALDELGGVLAGESLQIACVYGDLTQHLQQRISGDGHLDVVDVLPVQLENLARKLPANERLRLVHGDSTALPFASASYERALLFFLLHEQPEAARRKTLAEALRVVRPGGQVVVMDYHRPHAWHPLRLPMNLILRTLEPFALDLWRQDFETWLPEGFHPAAMEKRTLFGGLYQLIRITV